MIALPGYHARLERTRRRAAASWPGRLATTSMWGKTYQNVAFEQKTSPSGRGGRSNVTKCHKAKVGKMSEILYWLKILQISVNYSKCSEDIAALMRQVGETPAIFFDDAWRIEARAAVDALCSQGARFRKIQPPAHLEVGSGYRDMARATRRYDQAAQLSAEWINTGDVKKAKQSMRAIKQGGKAIEQARRKLRR